MRSLAKPRKISRAIEATIRAIAAGYKPRKIILFGSFARGDYHQGSDLDLIIVKNTRQRFVDRTETVLGFCTEGIAVQPLVYTEKEMVRMFKEGNRFLEMALEEGKVVYEEQ